MSLSFASHVHRYWTSPGGQGLHQAWCWSTFGRRMSGRWHSTPLLVTMSHALSDTPMPWPSFRPWYSAGYAQQVHVCLLGWHSLYFKVSWKACSPCSVNNATPPEEFTVCQPRRMWVLTHHLLFSGLHGYRGKSSDGSHQRLRCYRLGCPWFQEAAATFPGFCYVISTIYSELQFYGSPTYSPQ